MGHTKGPYRDPASQWTSPNMYGAQTYHNQFSQNFSLNARKYVSDWAPVHMRMFCGISNIMHRIQYSLKEKISFNEQIKYNSYFHLCAYLHSQH